MYLGDGYDASAGLPGDAVDSGYRNDGLVLWCSPEAGASRIFLIDADRSVESCPATRTPVGCD